MTGDTPQPLDPDEIACRRCGAQVAQVCVKPSGERANAVHAIRRRDAAEANPDNRPVTGPRRKTNATPAGRSKGGKAAQAARRARKEKLAAEAQRLEAERLAAHAEKLAADAARYAERRAELRRLTLDNATAAAERFELGLRAMRRFETDDDGKVVTVAVEVKDAAGNTIRDPDSGEALVELTPVTYGWAKVQEIESLAKTAASALNSVRLEEGKPTGINEHQGIDGGSSKLSTASVAELIAYASENLPTDPG